MVFNMISLHNDQHFEISLKKVKLLRLLQRKGGSPGIIGTLLDVGAACQSLDFVELQRRL